MVAVRAEQPLQRVVGARQIGHAIAVEQAGAVAGGHLHEVVDGAGQRAGIPAPRGPGRQQALVAGLHADRIEPGPAGENVGGRTKPAMRATDVRPKSSGALQATLHKRADALQRLAQAPFPPTRSGLPAIASKRPCSFSPEAARGGRPSSVSAERTAAQ